MPGAQRDRPGERLRCDVVYETSKSGVESGIVPRGNNEAPAAQSNIPTTALQAE